MLEGLEGVAAGGTGGFDRQGWTQTLAGLGKRVFLMYNVHEDEPVVFTTRWTMSYLRGPLTRAQIKTLMDPRKAAAGQAAQAGTATMATPAAPAESTPAPGAAAAPPAAPAASPDATTPTPPSPGAPPAVPAAAPAAPLSQRPLLPSGIEELFFPLRGPVQAEAVLEYRASVLGSGQARVTDAKRAVDTLLSVTALAPLAEGPLPLSWDQAARLELTPADLETQPRPEARFARPPAAATDPKSYTAWKRDFVDWLYRTQSVQLLYSPAFKLTSLPDEAEGDFRVRLAQAGRETRDAQKEALQQKYAPKLASLDERLRKAAQTVEREAEQARGAKMQTAISFGATLLSAFTGRKTLSTGTLGRATTAARGVGRSMDQASDVTRAQETVESLQQQRADLEAAFQADVEALEAKTDPTDEQLETVTVRPKKTDVSAQLIALAWVPYWVDAEGTATAAVG